jgi:hypothetical protein
VFTRATGAIHLRPLLETHRHPVTPRKLHQRVQPLAVMAAYHEHAIEWAARFERFAHGMNSS